MVVKKITKKPTVKKKAKEILPIVDINQVIKLLETRSLNEEQHMKILSLCLKDIGYFPIEDILKKGPDGSILFKGEALTVEEMVTFRGHLHTLRDNIAFKFISEQITFDAIKEGIYTSDSVSKLMFGKSAIYILKKFQEYIKNFDNQ